MPQTAASDMPLDQQFRTISILVGALIAGLVTFGAIVGALLLGGPFAPPPTGAPAPGPAPQPVGPSLDPVLIPVLALLLFGGIAGFVVVGAAAATRARRLWQQRADDDQGSHAIAGLLMATTIARAGLVEGVGLFGCVVTLLTGNPAGLAAAAVSVLFLASLIPARSRYRRLMEHATGGGLPTA